MFAYTSGTTGDPKGSIIPHSYYVSVCNFVELFGANLTHQDVALSYLPYAHIFEQGVFTYIFFTGMKVGYFSGTPLLFFDDLEVLKPTMLLVVPRILNRVYVKVMEEVEKKNMFVKWIFNKGVNAKNYYLQN